MIPFIVPESALTVERVDTRFLQIGDIICFIDQDGFGVAHRLVRIEQCNDVKRYFTRGDAQRCEEEVPEESLVFVVRKVQHRYLAYDTDGPVGRLATRLALSQSYRGVLLKNALQRLLRLGVAFMKQKK
ncbi:MAG: S24/S26 family peptidase [Deltaproteobacteria bacterium]|nr:S24/S26 family peptidase [Deltaproteobacteria bacterium]MBN2672939.1 S24/S26 family peptidase [Deltaproteobacteria bacterium]